MAEPSPKVLRAMKEPPGQVLLAEKQQLFVQYVLLSVFVFYFHYMLDLRPLLFLLGIKDDFSLPLSLMSTFTCKDSVFMVSVFSAWLLVLLVQLSPLTKLVLRGTWLTTQQRSSSSLFSRRPLWAVLVWAVMSTLWCCPSSISSADPGVAHPPVVPLRWRGCGIWHAWTLQKRACVLKCWDSCNIYIIIWSSFDYLYYNEEFLIEGPYTVFCVTRPVLSQEKCCAVLNVMKHAPLPWNPDIEQLVEEGLKIQHPLWVCLVVVVCTCVVSVSVCQLCSVVCMCVVLCCVAWCVCLCTFMFTVFILWMVFICYSFPIQEQY